MQLKLYFNVHAVIFSKISKFEESSLPMKRAKNYGINIFDYEGHVPWHKRYFSK